MNELRLALLVLGLVIVLGVYLSGRRKNASPANQGMEPEPSGEHPPQKLQTPLSEPEMPDAASMSAPKTLESDEQMRALLQEYDESVDWDSIHDEDIEWLDEDEDDINYDELMYQLNQGSQGSGITEHGSGGWHPSSTHTESVFVSVKQPDTKKVKQAVNTVQQVDSLVLVMHVLAVKGQLIGGSKIKSAMKALGLGYDETGLFHAYTRAESIDSQKHQQSVFSIANAIEPGYFEVDKLDSLRTPGLTLLLQLPGPIDNNAAFDRFYHTGKELAQRLGGVLCDESRNRLTQQTFNHMKDKISEYNIKLQLSQHPSIH